MERKKTFGQEVKYLRKQRGLNQKELAYSISGITPRTLGKIERGEKPFVNHIMATELANAFNLEGLAREEFFSRAGLNEGTPSEDYVESQIDKAAVHAFYQNLVVPAYIHDTFLTIRSINSAMLAFLGITIEDYKQEIVRHSGPHALRNIFELQFQARSNWTKDRAWREHAEMLVYRFRLLTRKYTDSQKYIDLLTDLNKMHDFKDIWRKLEKTDYVPQFSTVSTFHLLTGENLQFITAIATDSAYITNRDNKVIFVPASDITRAYLTQLNGQIPRYYLLFDRAHPDGYERVTI